MGIVPGLIALASCLALLLWVERIGARRSAAWRLVAHDGAKTIDPGLFIVKAKVVSDEVSVVNLGSSVESPSELSASPELVSDGFTVELASGARMLILPGTKLKTEGIVGAERKLLRAVTGSSGIEQHYSFEVKTGSELYLLACTAQRVAPPNDGPFRTQIAQPITPCEPDGAVHISAKQPHLWIAGCSLPIAVVLLLLGVPAGLLGYEVPVIVALVLGALSLLMQWVTLPAKAPAVLERLLTERNQTKSTDAPQVDPSGVRANSTVESEPNERDARPDALEEHLRSEAGSSRE